MSLQWTLVATFLYVEVGFMIILLLPFISPTRWQKIFRSRVVVALTSYGSLYFNVILVALVLLLLDAIREITKYKTRLNASNEAPNSALHYGPTMELVREFRAQRNFYISGTALFLWFVIKRLLTLITNSAQLIAENQAVKKQAESASRAAASLIDASKEAKKSEDDSKSTEDSDLHLENLKIKEQEIRLLNENLKSARNDLDAMKKQAESVSREYDNLLKEHAKVTSKLERLENENEPGSKKDN